MRTTTLKTLGTRVAAFALMFVAANSARATFEAIGDPLDVGSWQQYWKEFGIGNFDRVDAYIRSGVGVTWEAPGVRNFSPNTWTSMYTDNTFAWGSGPSVTLLNFATVVTPSMSVPFSIDLYAWEGTTIKDSVRAFWSGSSWTYGVADPAIFVPVPEAQTMIAAVLLLLPFGATTLRILRRNRSV